jgi:hypothetical protein
VTESGDWKGDWKDVFRKSRSCEHDYAVRRDSEGDMLEVLDRLGTRRGGGGPAYGAAASYSWSLPGGSATWQTGCIPFGLWVDGRAALLLLCDALGLRPPRDVTEAEGAVPYDARETRP